MYSPQTRILVVDDFQIARTVLRQILNGLGYEQVAEAEGPLTAIEIMMRRKGTPDEIGLVFVDLKMEQVGGLEFIKLLHGHPEFKKIPVIVASGESDNATMQSCMMAGAAGYLLKPVDIDRVANILELSEKMSQQS